MYSLFRGCKSRIDKRGLGVFKQFMKSRPGAKFQTRSAGWMAGWQPQAIQCPTGLETN